MVTDTPDHKQNSTILTIKQEKIRKRFSIVNHSNSPVVPETPMKGQCPILTIANQIVMIKNYFYKILDENTNPIIVPAKDSCTNECAAEPVRIISMSSRCRDLLFSSVQRSYSLSPKKNFARK